VSPARKARRYLPGQQGGCPLAKNPDPTQKITTSKGTTRTLDDWTTMFHLCLVILPARPEAARWIPVARRIFATFGDTDCRCAFVVPGPASVAERVLGEVENEVLIFIDPDLELVHDLDLGTLPAFVHLRQDTSLVADAEGWSASEWQRVAKAVGKAMAWTVPEVSGPGDPPSTPGWPVSTL
jgi:hypothetical protein